jgi:GNAT superfamily N-acetyltransferase
MIPASWQTNRLEFTTFQRSEAVVAKTIYDGNSNLRKFDPHFGEYPLCNFQKLIENDCTGAPRNGNPLFFMRCISDIETKTPLGYFQFELDAAGLGQCWIPMFVLSPEAQEKGIGKEAVEGIIAKAKEIGDITSIGMNVYAENRRALKFWFHCGWRELLGIDLEEVDGRSYTRMTLLQRVA